MLVELGTPVPKLAPKAQAVWDEIDPGKHPVITYMRIPDALSFQRGVDTEDWRRHLTGAVMSNDGVTNYEGGEVLSQLSHPYGPLSLAANLVDGKRFSWAWSDDAEVQRFLSEFHQIPEGRPDFYEETHWRRAGMRTLPPGVPSTIPDLSALLTNVGVNSIEAMVGGGSPAAASTPPLNGKGTAAGATTFTTGTAMTTNAYAQATVYVADTTTGDVVYGNIISNTAAGVLTVDQWYTAGGALGTTPVAGFEFFIVWASPPWLYMGITTTNITPATTDTTLSGEATTNGMARKQATFTYTSASAGSAAFTVSTTFTFTGASATTFYAMATFTSAVKSDTTDNMMLETSFSGSFTVTTNGDQATVTDTITAS